MRQGRPRVLEPLALGLIAAMIPSAPATAQAIPLDSGPYQVLRYEESYRALADPAKRTAFFDPIKYVPLGTDPNDYVSFGGELRGKIEHIRNEGYGKLGVKDENDLLLRLMLHADLHLGEHFRTFVQFAREDAPGKVFVGQPDRDRFDVQQAFFDVSSPTAFADNVTLRVGRQQMLLGSGRFVDPREIPNIPLTYNGARALVRWNNGPRIDAFLYRPTFIRPGPFDDGPDPHQVFGGLYGNSLLDWDRHIHVDGYYFLLLTKNLPLPGLPMDRRHTVGTRFWGDADPWDWDADILFQFGKQGTSEILAGGVAGKFGYSFPDPSHAWWRPRLVLHADYLSGNQDPTRHEVNTFNPLFPRGGPFAEPFTQAFSNVINFWPSLKLHPLDTLAVQFGPGFAWRASTHDAVYIAPARPIAGTAAVPGSYIGTSYVIQTTWVALPNLTLKADFVHVAAGPAITNAHGKSLDYAMFTSQFRF